MPSSVTMRMIGWFPISAHFRSTIFMVARSLQRRSRVALPFPGKILSLRVGAQRVILAQVAALGEAKSRELLPLGMPAAHLNDLLGHGYRHDHHAVIVRHDDVARHDKSVGAGNGHIDGKGKNR